MKKQIAAIAAVALYTHSACRLQKQDRAPVQL